MQLNIEKETLKNKNYRKVIYTDCRMQLVFMSLNKGEDIPLEIHDHITQFFRIESGYGYIKVGRKEYYVRDGDSVIVPAGKKHYVSNLGENPLKLYSIYTPFEHSKNKIDKRQPKN